MRKLLLISALAILPLATATAATYKCVEDGKITYQGTPCKGEGSAINVIPPEDAAAAANKGTATDPSAVAAKFDAQTKQLANEHRMRDIDYETKKLEAEISEYQSAMKSELDDLQQKKDYWKNQLGGSMREQAMADEMEKTAKKYEEKIQAVQDKINELNKEKTDLGAQTPRSETSESRESNERRSKE